MRNRPEIVRMLLQAGADANVTDEEGNTLLLYAAVFGHTPIVEALIRHGGISINPITGTTLPYNSRVQSSILRS